LIRYFISIKEQHPQQVLSLFTPHSLVLRCLLLLLHSHCGGIEFVSLILRHDLQLVLLFFDEAVECEGAIHPWKSGGSSAVIEKALQFSTQLINLTRLLISLTATHTWVRFKLWTVTQIMRIYLGYLSILKFIF
jgi:hypothetical protein